MTPSKLSFLLGSILALVPTTAMGDDGVQAPERLPMPRCVDHLIQVGCQEKLCEPGEGCCCTRCDNCPVCCEKAGCCEKSSCCEKTGCCEKSNCCEKTGCCEQKKHGSLTLGLGLSSDAGFFGSIILKKAADSCSAGAACKESCAGNCCPAAATCKENCKVKQAAYVIEPPDLLTVELLKGLPDRPLVGERLVRQDGTVNLGFYGVVDVAGLTIEQARERVEKYLSQFMCNPKVNLDVYSYNSKGIYVVADGAGCGNQTVRLPFTGNETVLDAIAQIGGLPPVATKQKIWVVRPGCGVMPVDWNGIVKKGDTSTNYALQAKDTIYIDSDTELKREVLGMAKQKKDGAANEASDYMKGVAGYVTDLQRALPAVIVFNQTPSLWQVMAEWALSYVLDYGPEETEEPTPAPNRGCLTQNPNAPEQEPVPPGAMPVEYRLLGGGPPLPSVRGVKISETQESADYPAWRAGVRVSPQYYPPPPAPLVNGMEIAVMPSPVPVFQPFGYVERCDATGYAPAPAYPVQQVGFHVVSPSPTQAPASSTPCLMKAEKDGDQYVVAAQRAGTSMHCTKLAMQMGAECTIRVAAANRKIVVASRDFEAAADMAEAREEEGKLVLSGNAVLLYRKNGSSCRVEADRIVLDLTQSTLSFQVMTNAAPATRTWGTSMHGQTPENKVFYTGGLLPVGEWTLPADQDYDVVKAIAHVKGTLFKCGFDGAHQPGNSTRSDMAEYPAVLFTVLRNTERGKIEIPVNLAEAIRNPKERLVVQPDDILVLQATPWQAFTHYLLSQYRYLTQGRDISRISGTVF